MISVSFYRAEERNDTEPWEKEGQILRLDRVTGRQPAQPARGFFLIDLIDLTNFLSLLMDGR